MYNIKYIKRRRHFKIALFTHRHDSTLSKAHVPYKMGRVQSIQFRIYTICFIRTKKKKRTQVLCTRTKRNNIEVK